MPPNTPKAPRLAEKVSKRGTAAKATKVLTEQLESIRKDDKAGTSAMCIASDESDLSSLEDGDEDQDKARDYSAHNIDADDGNCGPFTSQKTAGKAPAVQSMMSPSRIGIGITRPVHNTGIKTYGGRNKVSRLDAKPPRTPKASTSSYLLDADSSPLTPLTSSSPRKRRALPTTPQASVSPSKRKRRSDAEVNGDHFLSKRSPSKRGMTTNGSANGSIRNAISPTLERESKQEMQSKPIVSSSSAVRLGSDSAPAKPDIWSLDSLGSLAWVRLNHKNTPTGDLSEEAFWWPAKIEHVDERRMSLQARVYFPPAPTSRKFVRIEIGNPSPLNILSQLGSQRQERFGVNTFHYLPPPEFPSISSVTQCEDYSDIESRWNEAHKAMLLDDMDMNDGFPSSLAGVMSQVQKGHGVERRENHEISTEVGKRKGRHRTSAFESPEVEHWSPLPPDPNIQVPGELILAKEKRDRRLFWPAKVIGFVPPVNPKAPAKYLVKFLDTTEFEINRDMFYIYEQEEFGTCRMGKFDSAERLHGKDGDDDLDQNFYSKTSDQLFIPHPALPAPPPTEFCALPMLEQSAYILPIITKVLQNTYKPAEQRNVKFLKGGRQRAEITKDVPPKGNLTRQEFNELAHVVKCWALGFDTSNSDVQTGDSPSVPNRVENIPLSPPDLVSDEQAACEDPNESTITNENNESMSTSLHTDTNGSSIAVSSQPRDGDRPSSLPPCSLPPSSLPSSAIDGSPTNIPKPDIDNDLDLTNGDVAAGPEVTDATDLNTGPCLTTPSFNDLSKHEKINYCTDVLLEEAVIQLLLWRAGKRHSLHLLTDIEEETLHEIGSVMANDFDFVHTVLHLREKKEKSIKAKHPPKSSSGGTRSRPRNSLPQI